MSAQISIVLDDKIVRYAESHNKTRSKPYSELIAEFLNEWYESKLRELHQQYQTGNLTLRAMARQLGLEYRELYDLLEQEGLPL